MTAAPAPPRFFVDRGVGAVVVPSGLRAAGWRLTTMDERYGPGQSQLISDVEWIRDATSRGECLLTKDCAIARRPAEAAVVAMCDARVFALANARLTGPQMLDQLLTHQSTVFRMAVRATAPFVAAVGPVGVRRRPLAYP
jgi:hypothetical protein